MPNYKTTIKERALLAELGGDDADLYVLEQVKRVSVEDGVGIADIVRKNDEIIIKLTDKRVINLGSFKPQDGKDGSDGRDGHTPTKDEIQSLIRPYMDELKALVPKPIETKIIREELNVNVDEKIEKAISKIEFPKLPKQKEITAEDVRDKLETLKGKDRLDAKYIKNLPEWRGGGKSSLQFMADVDFGKLADKDNQVVTYDKDLQKFVLSESTGGIDSGTTLPATANNGDFFYDTDMNRLYIYQHICWSEALNIPGIILKEDDGILLTEDGCALLLEA